MSAVDTNFYKEKKKSTFYVALGFLLVSVLLTVFLYIYLSKINKETASLNTNIEQIDTSIKALNDNPEIQIYNIYERNKGLLEKLTFESRITSFVSHLKKNFGKYDISGEGFSYADGSVDISMTANTNDGGYAYEKVVKFITGYNTDEKALFRLDTGDTFTGYDELKFSGKYILK